MDQAQFRELEAFSKFGSNLDAVTAMTIDKGQKNTILLNQPLHQPMPVEKQIAVLYCGTKGLLKEVPINSVKDFEHDLLLVLGKTHREDVLEKLKGGVINDEISAIIEEVASDVAKELI